MESAIAGSPGTLLERPVFDGGGRLVGRVAAIGTRHGELRRIGIESVSAEPRPLRFVARAQFTIAQDGVVLAA